MKAKVFHVYKMNCFGSSRLMLQGKWDKDPEFIHLPSNETLPRLPFEFQSIKLSYNHIFQCAIKESRSSNNKWVFHGQSGLPYLLVFKILVWLRSCNEIKIVYDIHDLHEKSEYASIFDKIRYGIIRYHILKVFEYVVCKDNYITKITVSEGLSDIIESKYKCAKPNVVRNVVELKYSVEELSLKPRLDNTLLYFGTIKRAPIQLIKYLNNSGIELHMYGRDIKKESIEHLLGDSLPKNVKLYGKYLPYKLEFLMDYKYLLLYQPDVNTLNFKNSQPNKVFQSLSFGLSLIVSENFTEIIKSLKEIPGSVHIVRSKEDIKSVLNRKDVINEKYISQTLDHLDKLYMQSKNAYLNV